MTPIGGRKKTRAVAGFPERSGSVLQPKHMNATSHGGQHLL